MKIRIPDEKSFFATLSIGHNNAFHSIPLQILHHSIENISLENLLEFINKCNIKFCYSLCQLQDCNKNHRVTHQPNIMQNICMSMCPPFWPTVQWGCLLKSTWNIVLCCIALTIYDYTRMLYSCVLLSYTLFIQMFSFYLINNIVVYLS